MPRPIQVLTAALAVLLTTSAFARDSTRTRGATFSAPALASAPIAVSPGQGVTLFQTAATDSEGNAHFTRAGGVEIDMRRLAASTGRARGYLHVLAPDGLIVHNVAIESDASANRPRHFARLKMRSDGVVPKLQVPAAIGAAAETGIFVGKVVFTEGPLDSRSFDSTLAGMPFGTFQLAQINESVGGMGGPFGVSQQPPIGDPPPPPPSGDYLAVWSVELPNTVSSSLESARNQCAPAGLANAIQFIERTYGAYGYSFPQAFGRGFLGDGTLVGTFDTMARRSATNTCVGSGTQRCAQNQNGSSSIDALFAYLQAFDANRRITVSHQGGGELLPDDCGGNNNYDRDSLREGPLPRWNWICGHVASGDSVFLNIGFYTNGQVTGGHVVRVYGCGQVGEQKFLRVADDGAQDGMVDTDNDGLGDLCVQQAGLRYRQFNIGDNDNDGFVELGGPGREIEMAWALTPDLD